MATYKQEQAPLGYDQHTADGTTTFVTLYTLKSVSPRTRELWHVMAYLDNLWYAETLFKTLNDPSRVALAAGFGELFERGMISRTRGKDEYWTHDQLHEIARVALGMQQVKYATIAAGWISTSFPDYNTYLGTWVHQKEYLKHGIRCISFCEELHLSTLDLQRLY